MVAIMVASGGHRNYVSPPPLPPPPPPPLPPTPPPPNTERVRASPFPRSFPGVVFACSAIGFDRMFFFSSPDSIDKRKGKSQDAITDRSHALFLLFFSLTRRKNARAPKLCMFIYIYIYIFKSKKKTWKKSMKRSKRTRSAHALGGGREIKTTS